MAASQELTRKHHYELPITRRIRRLAYLGIGSASLVLLATAAYVTPKDITPGSIRIVWSNKEKEIDFFSKTHGQCHIGSHFGRWMPHIYCPV